MDVSRCRWKAASQEGIVDVEGEALMGKGKGGRQAGTVGISSAGTEVWMLGQKHVKIAR